jgi:DNA replication protein DnaC
MATMTLNELYPKVRIPEQYWRTDITMDSIINTLDKHSAKNLNDFLNRRVMWLNINGPDGNGKTTLVSLILKDLINKRVQCFRGDIVHFAQSFKDNDWAISPKYVQPTVVVMDDITKTPDSNTKNGFIEINLERLIQYRVYNNRPMIICSNVNVNKLAEKFGTSTAGIINSKFSPVNLTKSYHGLA